MSKPVRITRKGDGITTGHLY